MKKLVIGLGVGTLALALALALWPEAPAPTPTLDKRSAALPERPERTPPPPVEVKREPPRPFVPPPEKAQVTLEEQRLVRYLQAREATLPAFREYEEKQGEPGRVRARLGESLAAARMSEAEFRDMTRTIYAFVVDGQVRTDAVVLDGDERVDIEARLADIDEMLNARPVSAETRRALETEREALQERLVTVSQETAARMARMSESELRAKMESRTVRNSALLDRYRERVEAAAHPPFDAFVAGAPTP